jgi:hypothetical protein
VKNPKHKKSKVKALKVKDPSTLMASFRRIWSLTQKEVKVLWNDRLAMVLLFLFPVSMILLATYGGTTSDTGPEGDVISMATSRFSVPKLGLLDLDNSEGFESEDLSQDFCGIFEEYETEGECILYRNYSRNQMEEMIGSGDINGYIVIEDGFEFNISTHFVAFFTVVFDAYDLFVLSDGIGLIDEIVDSFKEQYEFYGAIHIERQVVNLPEKAATLFSMCAYFYPILAFAMPVLIESQILINDIPKDRMILTPANKKEVLISKLLGGSFLCSSSAISMTFISLAVGLQTKVSMWTFLFIMESCVLVSIAIGLFISAISDTSLAGFQYSLLVFLVQEIVMVFVLNDLPLSFFPIFGTQELIERVILKGTPLLDVQNPLGIPYIYIIWAEWLIFTIGAYIAYNHKKGVI